MKIKKILIANRGEIAVRVVKTCKKLGIKTVGLYAADDKDLIHSKVVDEAFLLVGQTLSETYLNGDKIIEIAKKCGADAIHPGYGFLSENSKFAKAVEDNGLIFIGPRSPNILLMGDKIESKIKAKDLGVPVIPGFNGQDQSLENLKVEAQKVGFPLLIKASAGGGGKGMRVVRNAQDFERSLASAKNEAMKAFKNDAVLLEKFIENSRHIEVQVFGDGKGNAIHLFERECSLQRRHQKIIEESPSVALNMDLRNAVCLEAVKLTSGISYRGAGTVEFIYTNGKFYFLEMNTRLQVEHPVTEMVTGLDLVELQIKIAQGEELLDQSLVEMKGYALEARIYAEDPDHEFLPQTGKILYINQDSGFRVDTGYEVGNDVTINYDPMIAKIIVHADSREEVVGKMQAALTSNPFLGVKTNRDFLIALISDQNFIPANYDTNYVEREITKILNFQQENQFGDFAVLALISEFLQVQTSNTWKGIFDAFSNKRTLIKRVKINDHEHIFTLTKNADQFELNGQEFKVLSYLRNNLTIKINDQQFSIVWEQNLQEQNYYVAVGAKTYLVQDFQKLSNQNNSTFDEDGIFSPMPGKVFKVLKKIGDKVKENEVVVVLEAMKMEHELKALRDGVVENLFFLEGTQVTAGQKIVQLKEV
jgi:3-methylcrotonyl-CoA carboxylase alpha subunit